MRMFFTRSVVIYGKTTFRHLQKERVLMIEIYPTDREALERDCDIDFFIASGPGGQKRNKVETGVRLIHRSSGIMVTATERRSQYANREAAFERMADRLRQRQTISTPRFATRPTKASRERRLMAKRHNSLTKKQRSLPSDA
jgi:protein subunit release factor B